MTISKPFHRIVRPSDTEFGYSKFTEGLASRNRSLIRAFKIIERDLIELLDYVEPCDNNLSTYSHRIYELFLRACTEFEANCKEILKDNGYNRSRYNIEDYFKLNSAMKLSEYVLMINVWKDTPKIFKPFTEWDNGHSLTWYQQYNKVKHNRNLNFQYANLENLISAVAAVQLLLFCQFNMHAFSEFQNASHLNSSDDGYVYNDYSIFKIKFTGEWLESEKYDSAISILEYENAEFDMYPF